VTSTAAVPRRGRLLAARAAAAGIVGGGFGIAVATVVAALAALVTRADAAHLAMLPVAVGLAALAVATGTTTAHLFGLLAGRPVIAVLVLTVAILVLPLGAAVAGLTAPAALAPLLHAVSDATPGALFGRAIGTSTIGALGAGGLWAGQLGLLAWCAATAVPAALRFSRRSA
jgi:ABC-2 type transport system permease protein